MLVYQSMGRQRNKGLISTHIGLFGRDIGSFAREPWWSFKGPTSRCHARLGSLLSIGCCCRDMGLFCREVGLFGGNTELFSGLYIYSHPNISMHINMHTHTHTRTHTKTGAQKQTQTQTQTQTQIHTQKQAQNGVQTWKLRHSGPRVKPCTPLSQPHKHVSEVHDVQIHPLSHTHKHTPEPGDEKRGSSQQPLTPHHDQCVPVGRQIHTNTHTCTR